ncbi:SRPBCC family protein [Cellulomonas oligotrophica]|uniref:Uncharacterized protein YndB with AHSA1/START domain n=1 Tax=Cellulomonas oligotrophica TaxID=931536 RepID=A0A7Y9FC16_9CELL|nr:SRPBCC family protein [Cellulomonas oligotrophica]NYD84465.1 uncharacterized protein YndB with AHSA1/START domain [Cellulomonas oligotrophica]GIG33893.1 hypothetical protein Col01nite_30520 [Cellulomonas oligotrophica]
MSATPTGPGQTPEPLAVLRQGEGDAEVELRRSYPTTADDLWDALTAPGRVRRWLGALHGDLQPGGTVQLRMGDDVPGADDVATCTVLACEPPEHLRLDWRFPGEEVSRVDVALVPRGAQGTELVLRHARLADGAARGYAGGWHVVADQLDDHLAGRQVRSWDDLFDARLALYPAAGPRAS